MGSGADMEGDVAAVVVEVVLHPVEAALADDPEGNTGFQERSAHEHGDITAREKEGSAGIGGLVPFIVRSFLVLGIPGRRGFRAVGDEKGGAAQRGEEAGAQGDGTAADEVATDTVLLAGSDDSIEIDVITDEVANLLVRKGCAAVVHEAGTVAMNLDILGFRALCQA